MRGRLGKVLVTAIVLPLLAASVMSALGAPAFPRTFILALAGLSSLCFLLAYSLRSRAPNAQLSLFTLVLLLIWPEVVLRLAGFEFDPRSVVQFGRPTPQEIMALKPDPELFWRLPPARPGVNSYGFFGPEFRIPKPPGVFRLVFFGDSCTQQGYPRGVIEKLRIDRLGERTYEAFNLGVAGYTSHQGRVIAERWAGKFEPDVGIVFFGWNDHWLAYGATDGEKAARGNRTPQWIRWLLSRSRLVQWIVKQRVGGAPTPLTLPRVPLPEYRDNLVAIGERIEAAGGRVLLVTAPSSHETVGVPSELVDSGHAISAETVVSWHRDYNDAVRTVAARRGWLLLDLAIRANEMSQPQAFFMDDGIHFTRRGLDWIATQVKDVVASEILSP